MPDHQGREGRKPRPKYSTGVSVKGTCCQCGKEVRTPFVPRDPGAVLCDDCYDTRFGKPPPGAQAKARGKLYEGVCDQCGASCNIPWIPDNEQPAICWSCVRGLPSLPEHSRLAGAERTAGGRVVRIKKKS